MPPPSVPWPPRPRPRRYALPEASEDLSPLIYAEPGAVVGRQRLLRLLCWRVKKHCGKRPVFDGFVAVDEGKEGEGADVALAWRGTVFFEEWQLNLQDDTMARPRALHTAPRPPAPPHSHPAPGPGWAQGAGPRHRAWPAPLAARPRRPARALSTPVDCLCSRAMYRPHEAIVPRSRAGQVARPGGGIHRAHGARQAVGCARPGPGPVHWSRPAPCGPGLAASLSAPGCGGP
jgi:hypothetical protein